MTTETTPTQACRRCGDSPDAGIHKVAVPGCHEFIPAPPGLMAAIAKRREDLTHRLAASDCRLVTYESHADGHTVVFYTADDTRVELTAQRWPQLWHNLIAALLDHDRLTKLVQPMRELADRHRDQLATALDWVDHLTLEVLQRAAERNELRLQAEDLMYELRDLTGTADLARNEAQLRALITGYDHHLLGYKLVAGVHNVAYVRKPGERLTMVGALTFGELAAEVRARLIADRLMHERVRRQAAERHRDEAREEIRQLNIQNDLLVAQLEDAATQIKALEQTTAEAMAGREAVAGELEIERAQRRHLTDQLSEARTRQLDLEDEIAVDAPLMRRLATERGRLRAMLDAGDIEGARRLVSVCWRCDGLEMVGAPGATADAPELITCPVCVVEGV